MRSKITTIIMTIVIFLIASVFGLFGTILWSEFKRLETSIQPEDVKTIISENTNTIDKNMKAPEILDNPFDEIQEEEK